LLDHCRFPAWSAEPNGGTLRLTATICPKSATTSEFGLTHGPANVILTSCRRIPSCAFVTRFWGDLQKCTFSDELQAIDDQAFYGRDLLKVVDLERCASLSVIGWNAFGSCNALTSLRLPDALVRIEDAAFTGCRKLSSVKLTPMLTHLGPHAFRSCAGLEVADLSGCRSLETIATGAFQGCTALQPIDLSSCASLVSIGVGAFPMHLEERILFSPGLPRSSEWFAW